jgi:predicted alpha/beta superfamily hydrolase
MRITPGARRALLLAGLPLAVSACAPQAAQRAVPGDELEIRVSTPATTAAGADVYIAGNFNGWNPGHPEFRLMSRGDGVYAAPLPVTARGLVLEFKFTLGSWESVETDSAGADVPNRIYAVPESGPGIYHASIAGWRDPAAPRPPTTAGPTVEIVSDTFRMPQLGASRRVWLYLPPDYATSGRRYPVLYMHDGQNVFDAATSYAGEWGVDETLDSLHALGDRGVIVVAIDNGGSRRVAEYLPWPVPPHGGGEGEAYVAFLVHTLKPYVDARYRTLPDAANTGIAGSSLGAVISLYAALEHPEVFGRAGVFSPALWAAPPLFDLVAGFDRARPRPRLYFVTGAREGSEPGAVVREHQRMIAALEDAGFTPGADLVGWIRADGTHSEWFWRREFPAAYDWLFANAHP